jgi:hypothetical protein
VLSSESLQTMLTPPTLADGSQSPAGYDLVVQDSAAGPYYWHDGGGSGVDLLGQTAFGFHAHLGYLRDQTLIVVVLANTGTSDVDGARNAALKAVVYR